MKNKIAFCFLFALVAPLMLDVSIVFAQAAVPAGTPDLTPPSLLGSLAENAPAFAIIFLIFYYMVVKPQQTKQRQQDELVKNLAKGATVLTSSGIIGRVAGIEKDYILLELATNVKVRFQPSHIVKSLDPQGGEQESQKDKA